jgi:hypothetical protein
MRAIYSRACKKKEVKACLKVRHLDETFCDNLQHLL